MANLRDKANSLQSQIDRKLSPPIANQNLTPRRIRIAQSIREDGHRLIRIQSALRSLADRIESDTLPDVLEKVHSIKQVREILYGWQMRESPEREQLLQILLHQPPPIDPVSLRIKEAEEALVGQKIPGFFPTPRDLADRMVQLADLQEDHEVLEPSAGKGDLADAIMRHCDKAGLEITLTCIEPHYELCQILDLKGYSYFQADFLSVSGTVDRIIMNPPFEKGIDIRHLLHAYEMLNPGGILVALLGANLWAQGKIKTEFREQLHEWIGTGQILHSEQIENAFKGPQSFKQTGVTCHLIAVQKGFKL